MSSMEYAFEKLEYMLENYPIHSSLDKENVELKVCNDGKIFFLLKPKNQDTIYTFRLSITLHNHIEIYTIENNPFHSDPSLQRAFNIFIDFLISFSNQLHAKLFIYRHQSKSNSLNTSIFNDFFVQRDFRSFTIEEVSSLHQSNIVGKVSPCFIKELQPNILPKHMMKKDLLIEAATVFQNLDPTFKANRINNISKLKYSFFGHKGTFQVSYDNGFYLKDEEIDMEIPFIDNTISAEHAKEFLKRLEAKKKMEYIFEPTTFPVAPAGIAHSLAKKMMPYLQKDYGLKELHIACLKKKFKKTTFYGYKVITILDHIFIASTSSSNKTCKLFLHTKNKDEAERFLFEDAEKKIKQALL